MLLLMAFGFNSFIQSQEIKKFERLECKGQIPDYFVSYLNDKIASDRQKMESDDNMSKSDARDFSALSNYKLQQLIRSGRLLYGDPLTVYANKVLDKLKKASKKDLNHITVYTLKSNEVNAFATHQGIIYITVGLWGQIENESQLAFVLAHEITHVIEKHGQVRYKYSRDLVKSGKYGDENLSNLFKYTKEHELDADKAGLKLAADAGYDAESLLGTYQVLLYSYLPIDEMPVNYAWLENDKFKIPDTYKKKEIKPISAEEDEDDEFRTHPNIKNRRAAVERMVKDYTKNKGVIYLSGTEAEFKSVQELARFEMMNIYIRNAQYISGMYHNLILSQKYPKNEFLAKTAAMTWYGSVKFKNSDDADQDENEDNDLKKEGEIQQLFYFFKKMNKKYLNILAVKEIWEASASFPQDSFLKIIRERIIDEFIVNKAGSLDDFASTFDTIPVIVEKESNLPDKPKSKYDKISKKKETIVSNDYTHYAWVAILNNPEFEKSFNKQLEVQRQKTKEEDDEEDDVVKESSMNLKTLALVSPNFYKNDTRKNVNTNVSKADVNEKLLIGMVEDNAEKLGIKLKTIDNFMDQDFDTKAYNNFSLLYDYLGERSKFSERDFYPYYAQYTPTLINDFGSSHIALFSMYTEINKRPFNSGACLLSLLTVYPFPVYLIWQLSKDTHTEYSFFVYNLETHNPAFISTKRLKSSLNINMQGAYIYNSLNQITRKK